MHTKHVEVLHHFPSKSHTSINTCPTIISPLVLHTHFSKRILYSHNQLQSIETHKSLPNPLLILLLHKVIQGHIVPMKIGPLFSSLPRNLLDDQVEYPNDSLT